MARLLGDRRGMAVVALGGYARRELCPGSDIDLLLVHDGWGHADLQAVVAELCYPLWDAGLSVGHAVRTPAEAVAAAGERIDTATAMLDRRLVAGDPGLLDALASRVQRWTRRQRRRLIAELAAADGERRERHGEHPGILEPDLKNGAGGLRDVHSLRWAGGCAVGDISLDALVAAGYVGAGDRHRLSVANAALLEARCALHLVRPTNRGQETDVLRLQDQDDAAALLGLVEPSGAGDGGALLRRVGLAARTVSHVHGRAWPLLLNDVAGTRRRRRTGGVEVAAGTRLHDGLIAADPDPGNGSWPLQVIAVAAGHRAHLTRSTAESVQRAAAERPDGPWTAEDRQAFLDILGAPGGAATGLQDADHLGVLSAYLPDWPAVRGRPQRNPLHRFDLDTHAAQAVEALHRLVAEGEAAELFRGIERTDVLLLAVWLHDVGKGWPGDHSEVGAEVADRWLEHMGCEPDTRRRVSDLVRLHLLLPDVATRRDLDDETEIRAVARAVDDVELLDSLYLLSLADGRATGPAAWSAWKDSLMARLHAAVRACLGAALPRGFRAACGDERPSVEQRATLEHAAPPDYLDTVDGAQATAHAVLLRTPLGHHELRAGVRPGHVAGTSVVSVVAADRAGLVADCAGVLAAHDLGVVEARVFTGPTGLVLDWFTVEGHGDEAALTADLRRVSAGQVSVEQLLGRRRRPAGPVTAEPTHITFRDATTIEVRAPDTPGLLYRLCRTLYAEGLSVTTARVSSVGLSVVDVFDVAAPIVPNAVARLKSALLSAATPAN